MFYLKIKPESFCPLLFQEPARVMSVGAVYDRALFLESKKYARSQTAPTATSPLLGQAPVPGGEKSV